MKKNQALLAVLCMLIASPSLLAQNLYVGSNSPESTNFTSGTNGYNNIYVGYTTNASNSMLAIMLLLLVFKATVLKARKYLGVETSNE